MDYVHKFDAIGAADACTVGETGANLGEMRRAGLPVPPGFCLSVEAYRAFVAGGAVDRTIGRILAGLQVEDPEDVEVRTEQIRNFMIAQQMPARIAEEILQGYYELSLDLGSGVAPVPAAVRSSTTARDLPGPPAIGPPKAYLNVHGEADLLEHVKRCWGSLWTGQAVAHRVRQGVDHAHMALAVVVQAMIQSEVSGILFTASPSASSREELVIIASWGLGEAIISGLVTPDTFMARKSDGAILARDIANKNRTVECAREGGTIEREVPPERRCIPAVSDAQIAELVALGTQIEKLCGAPLDVEWAFARGSVYILQAIARRTSCHLVPAWMGVGE
jgi:phosphoenolpyruvate synthase/pyruvate phosphate dikinase